LLWNDAELGIEWPFDASMSVKQTEKDNLAPSFADIIANGDHF
jgi:dTDP-4-dehydrorhamnose 3,5-epimerase-like enzyme